TPDILVPNQARYQATLHPEFDIMVCHRIKINLCINFFKGQSLYDDIFSHHTKKFWLRREFNS
ncbi:MAG TPA: hypothetical protein PL140_06990, partial [Ferrovaceae bacterium]|nr:hypothetical protein [Ferrovaceae bacterium]